MKKLILILLLTTSFLSLKAQTFAEWFKQNKTQKKYLLQQIAALEIYIGFAQKGYFVARSGLNTISSFKNSDLDLHTDFFNSLKSVSPWIRNNKKVDDMIAIEKRIVQRYSADYRKAQQSNLLSTSEIAYFKSVYSRLMSECSNIIYKLKLVTTPNAVEMKDDERLRSIDALYIELLDNYKFVKGFGNDIMLVVKSRIIDKNAVQKSQVLYGTK
jgi:single-stranded DNA-specific DHH superfamily exonuclease